MILFGSFLIRGDWMARGLPIRSDIGPDVLRGLARRENNGRAASRMFAIANALEGMERAEAARLAGMERQALHDAVVRFNSEGIAGLHDRPRSGMPPRLNKEQQAELKAWIMAGPDPERDGVSSLRLVDIGRHIAGHYGVAYAISSLSDLMARLGLSWQKARPLHPQGDPEARATFKKTSFHRSRR